ncbi:thymidylate synthase [Methylobacterium ajmalii]|uniref:Thymidylate synthase n=1 Tax=Methylobacterium ajmalii TaxID=2738439 RepID=A0ABU9ZP93_9HYPH
MFSPLGELVWYLSGSNQLEQIIHYIPKYKNYSNDGTSLSGAYGPRIFEVDRRINSHNPTDHWQRIIDLLIKRGDTRNAVIQIFSNSDTYADNKDVPCTCTMQFAVRGKRLNLHVHMRSNDAVLGLPHDIFAFTMMQEIAARELGVEIGRYTHSVASLHLYDDTHEAQPRSMAQQFLDEPLPDDVPMPPMPWGDPWPALRYLIAAERAIREGKYDHADIEGMDPYWKDLILLLRAHSIAKSPDGEHELHRLTSQFASNVYHLYVLDRLERKRVKRNSTPDMFKDYQNGNEKDT